MPIANRGVHCVPKNVTTLSHYSSDLIIFAHKWYWERRQSNGTLFSHLT